MGDVMGQRATFSVIAPAKDEEELIEEFHQRVAAALEPLGEPFEVIIVNDGSSDRTPAILRELNQRDARFKSITLSRSFGAEPAFTAGIDYAEGEAVILIDSDLQDPPEVIPELIAKWREGYELVYAVRASREGETWFKTTTAALFYRLMDRITSVNVPLDTGTFRLMDRSVVRALSQMREHNRSMRLLSVWTGFTQTGVPFRRQARKAGSTKYPLRKMIRLTLDNVTSFSYVPLQLATYFGFAVAALSVLAMVVVIIGRLSGSQSFFGQATTLISVLFLGGVQLIFLGIIGEYLGRIYDEVRSRPLYIVSRAVGFDGKPQPEERASAPTPDDEVAPSARSYRN